MSLPSFPLFLLLLIPLSLCEELLVSKQYTEYLKKRVSWEVADYDENVFKGWTVEEAGSLLGAVSPMLDTGIDVAQVEPDYALPSSIDWSGAGCDHGVKNQGKCGSCWAVATAGMLSDRCCLQGNDKGWLSAQELVSCDKKNNGCSGGWCTWALDYVRSVNGLVQEACLPYEAMDKPCSKQCIDGKPWEASHVCNCPAYKMCVGVESMKTCLKTGPITAAFGVCKSFFSYKSGVYRCDCQGNYVGLHAILIMGYSSSAGCSYRVRNSWGVSWGIQGYFDINCNECGISGTYANGNVMCEKVG